MFFLHKLTAVHIKAFNVLFGSRFLQSLSTNLSQQYLSVLEGIRKRTQSTSEIVYGIQPVLSAVFSKQRVIFRVFVRDDILRVPKESLHELNPWLAAAIEHIAGTTKIEAVPRDFLSALTNGRSHQGIALECTPMPTPSIHGLKPNSLLHFHHCKLQLPKSYSCCSSSSMVLFMDRIQDVMNMGSILRSAVFFGVPSVILSAFHSATPSPLISKLSSGAMESLRFYRATDPASTLKQLSNAGFIVMGTAGMQSDSMGNVHHRQPVELSRIQPEMVGVSNSDPPKPLVLVLGSEAHGLMTNVLSACNVIVRIPGVVDSHQVGGLASTTSQLPTSLNVAAATAILLHQIKQLRS